MAQEKMLQVMIRVSINDAADKYIKEFNESGMAMYKLRKPQLVAEALLDYMANHPVEK